GLRRPAPRWFWSEHFHDCSRGSVAGVRVALQGEFDVAAGVDEGLQALIRIEQEGPAWNNEDPVGVPHGAAAQAGVFGGWSIIINPSGMIRAEAGQPPDLGEAFRERIVHRNPTGG